MDRSEAIQPDPALGPPALVRLERRLRLPVPPAWRHRVAETILSEDWTRRHQNRFRWLRAHRMQIMVAAIVFDLAFVAVTAVATGNFFAGFPALYGLMPLIVTLSRSTAGQNPDEVVSQARITALRWNGLRPDGSLDPAPDHWLTLAALPPWAVATIAVVEVATIVAVISAPVLLVVVL